MKTLFFLLQTHIHLHYPMGDVSDITPCPKPELGEYCIRVFALAKIYKSQPATIAQHLAEILQSDSTHFIQVNALGGYVNFTLTDTVWHKLFQEDFHAPMPKPETIVVDYIGMNIGKPPHVGHICTPLQGQAIINLLRYFGHTVIGDSHLGDWGSLFGKLLIGFQKYGNLEKLEEDAINHLLEIYIAITKDIEHDANIEQSCRDAFVELSNGNPEYMELWAKFTTASIATNKKILELMHVHQDFDIGESFYEGIALPKIGNQPPLQFPMNMIVDELLEKNIAIKNDDGSVGVVFPEETKMPSTILQKKDGTNLYLTSDLAAIKYRITNGWKSDRIIYFIDARQSLHLKQVFWVAKNAWGDILANVELTHAANGAIVLPEGAMSTRKGNIIRLDALVDTGFTQVKKILSEKGKILSDSDMTEITVAAIKYSYLSQDREKDIVFNWEKALNFEGNSGPYIQYAYVRIRKILANIQLQEMDISTVNFGKYDRELLQKILQFPDILQRSVEAYKAHHIAIFAYELAVVINTFYVHVSNITQESDTGIQMLRYKLLSRAADALVLAFDILGIRMPSEM